MISNTMHSFGNELKILIAVFLFVLSIGYFTGVSFLNDTTHFSANGIQQNYNGNETDENAKVMQFKKTKREMITIIHTHILSLSVIFFIAALLVITTGLPTKYKMLLILEPLISLIFTFGGIYLLWTGVFWMKYVVIISGFLMTFFYSISIITIYYYLFKSK